MWRSVAALRDVEGRSITHAVYRDFLYLVEITRCLYLVSTQNLVILFLFWAMDTYSKYVYVIYSTDIAVQCIQNLNPLANVHLLAITSVTKYLHTVCMRVISELKPMHSEMRHLPAHLTLTCTLGLASVASSAPGNSAFLCCDAPMCLLLGVGPSMCIYIPHFSKSCDFHLITINKM